MTHLRRATAAILFTIALLPPLWMEGSDEAAVESLSVRELRTAVEREKRAWDRLDGRDDDPMAQRRAQAELRAVASTYEKVIRDDPNLAEAWAAYGLLLSRVGERENAMRVFLRANELNPNLPMVKNQIGNYLAEDGDYQDALAYYLAAIELEPSQPIYHYQLGSLLVAFRDFFVADGMFDRATIDSQMQVAFKSAADLAPEQWGFVYRYAESFYDLADPDWKAALIEWEKLRRRASDGVERQTVMLHQARVLAELNRDEEASALLSMVTAPVLQQSRQTVVDMLEESEKE